MKRALKDVIIAIVGVIAAAASLHFFLTHIEGVVLAGLPIEEAKIRASRSGVTPMRAYEIAYGECQRLMREMPEDERVTYMYPQPVRAYLFTDDRKYVFPAGAFRKYGWGYRSAYVVDATNGDVLWDNHLFCRSENLVHIHD